MFVGSPPRLFGMAGTVANIAGVVRTGSRQKYRLWLSSSVSTTKDADETRRSSEEFLDIEEEQILFYSVDLPDWALGKASIAGCQYPWVGALQIKFT